MYELKHLYRSIRQQSIDLEKLEFIISDDGSTDSTKSMVDKWIEMSEISIKFITQKNQGPGAARNHGMKVAQGDLFLFIDSDCEAHPDWINIIYEEYQKNILNYNIPKYIGIYDTLQLKINIIQIKAYHIMKMEYFLSKYN